MFSDPLESNIAKKIVLKKNLTRETSLENQTTSFDK